MSAGVGDGSNDACVEDWLEEVLGLIAPSEGNGNADPSPDDREYGEDNEGEKHDPRRFGDAVSVDCVVVIVVGDHDGVRVGVSVNGGAVVVEVNGLVEVLGAEEGLEPEAEHVERGHTSGDEADEPEELAERIVAGEGAVEDFVFGEKAAPGGEARE